MTAEDVERIAERVSWAAHEAHDSLILDWSLSDRVTEAIENAVRRELAPFINHDRARTDDTS